MYGKKYWGVERTTFIVAPDGKIARVLTKVKPGGHDAMVLKALEELSR
jgi:peroxiredoxin Q/BCP